jgi:hypothetical protein
MPSLCRFCREPISWEGRRPLNPNGTDHVPTCSGQKPKTATTVRDFARCDRCNEMIVWHNTYTASGRKSVPLNPGDAKQDHRNTCAGHPGRIRKVMAAMVAESRAANRAECAGGAL